MEQVVELVKKLEIEYQLFSHPAVFTVEESRDHRPPVECGETKNLFLRNRRGDRHYLVVIEADKQLDLKRLGEQLGEKVGFASPERLQKYLNLTPGSVSPFGLINDENNEVVLVVDKRLLKEERIACHPNDNTYTIVLNTSDWQKAMEYLGNEIRESDLDH